MTRLRPITRGAAVLLAALAPFAIACSGRPPASLGPVPAGAPEAALLAPGDALRLAVWSHPEFSGEFTVGRDSALVHPLYQGVKVAGLSVAMAKGRLRELLATYDQNVRLTVEPLWPVSVVGEVRLPNLYRLAPGTTVAQAVALAGGPSERGRLSRVQVLRRQGAMTLDLTSDYARSQEIVVASGDQVMVARRSDFSFVRDVVVPLTSITAAIAALISVSKQ